MGNANKNQTVHDEMDNSQDSEDNLKLNNRALKSNFLYMIS